MIRRRTLLVAGVGSIGTLALGWSLLPPRQRLRTAEPLPAGPGRYAMNGWVEIGTDNRVTVVMCKSEMGQGVHTGLAQVLAEELDAAWSQVRIVMSPIDNIYNNLATTVDGLPFHPDDDGAVKRLAGWFTAKTMREIGVMVTGGSSSLKDLWEPMREAGASARAMLVAAAAARWSVPAAECTASQGRVQHPGGHAATFGELAEDAARQPLPERAALKDRAAFRLIGQPLARLEAASKLDGSARFGIDVLPAGLLYASVTMCPTLGGGVAAFDASAALGLAGVRKVFRVDGHHGGTAGVAAIADTPYQAMRALRAVKIDWTAGPAAQLQSEDVMRQLAQTLDHETGFAFYHHGDAPAALKTAAKVISAEYRAPYLAHTTMEPMNCTVQFRDGRATVWVSTQIPGVARAAVAAVLGIAARQVDVQVQWLGGGFGRRLEADFIAQAAAVAREAGGAPVQTLWTREQDIAHDFYRPACVARFQAGFDAQGRLLAWLNTSAGQAIVPQVLSRSFGLPGAGPDKTTSEGAFDQPYEWPAARIGHAAVELPVPVGFWRSVGHSHQAFFKECFIDEAAAAAGQDPVAWRLALLHNHPRHAEVLRRAAQRAGWGAPLPPAADGRPRARGVALHQSFGSIVAQVAEVSISADRTIRVHRVVCVIDCGIAVNPNLVRQQLESAIVYGLSAALYGQIDIRNGQVQQSNFHDYPALRIQDCPAIDTEIVPSQRPPEGVGEPGTPPIAPAVANALFALTGQRQRALPLRLS